jgi:hypothetical protein
VPRGRRAEQRPKQGKSLDAASNTQVAPAKPKIGPETVTEPSSGSAPSEDV